MKKVTELKQQEELLDTMDNKNYSELEFTQIENTPFTIVKQENKYFGLIGEHRITEEYEDLNKIKKDIVEISWDRIVQVIWAITEKYNKIKLEE